MTDGELNIKSGETTEQFKERIKAMKKATPAESKPVQEPKVAPVDSAQSTQEKAPKPTVEVDTASSKGEQAVNSAEAPADKKAEKADVDIREWAKRKGIRDSDSALRSLRNLEQKLTALASEKAKLEQNVPRGIYEPSYQPQPAMPPVQPPAAYYPPIDRQRMIEVEAAKRGWDPADFEKVVELSNELININLARQKQQYDSELAEIRRENRRNAELRDLITDPLFTNPDVQYEMHRVLEENPKAFALDPAPYTWAFNEAQRRLARRFLQGERVETESKSLPSEPPPAKGKSSDNLGSLENPDNVLNEKFFSAKSSEEKRKILTSLGAVNTL